MAVVFGVPVVRILRFLEQLPVDRLQHDAPVVDVILDFDVARHDVEDIGLDVVVGPALGAVKGVGLFLVIGHNVLLVRVDQPQDVAEFVQHGFLEFLGVSIIGVQAVELHGGLVCRHLHAKLAQG